MRAILAHTAIRVIDAELLLRSVEVYEVRRSTSPMRTSWPAPSAPGIGVIASFDRSIDQVTTIRRGEPA